MYNVRLQPPRHIVAGAAEYLSAFFDRLMIDLDGCELSFRKLSVKSTKPAVVAAQVGATSGGELQLQLELGVCVRRFPSPFVNF